MTTIKSKENPTNLLSIMSISHSNNSIAILTNIGGVGTFGCALEGHLVFKGSKNSPFFIYKSLMRSLGI